MSVCPITACLCTSSHVSRWITTAVSSAYETIFPLSSSDYMSFVGCCKAQHNITIKHMKIWVEGNDILLGTAPIFTPTNKNKCIVCQICSTLVNSRGSTH